MGSTSALITATFASVRDLVNRPEHEGLERDAASTLLEQFDQGKNVIDRIIAHGFDTRAERAAAKRMGVGSGKILDSHRHHLHWCSAVCNHCRAPVYYPLARCRSQKSQLLVVERTASSAKRILE